MDANLVCFLIAVLGCFLGWWELRSHKPKKRPELPPVRYTDFVWVKCENGWRKWDVKRQEWQP